jgi:hypothetical protein
LNDIYVFVAVFLVLLLLANEIGRWAGRRYAAGRSGADESISLIVGSVLALLAFVLALNLSGATTRYWDRQDAVLNESNAISTAWLQAGAVAGPSADALAQDIANYALIRRDYIVAGWGDPVIEETINQTFDLQNRIWSRVSTVVRDNPGPATSSLMNAVNTAFDASSATRFAMEFRTPRQVILLLFWMSVFASGAVGVQLGVLGQRNRVPSSVICLLWCVVVVEIYDVGAARVWTFRTDARTFDWTLQGMGVATTEIPG